MPIERLRARIAASRSRSPKKRQRATDQDLEDSHDAKQGRHCLTANTSARPAKRRTSEHISTGTMPPRTSLARLPLTTPPSPASFRSDQDQGQDQNKEKWSTRSLQELEQDMVFEAWLSGLSAQERPPSFYPGYRRVARMKDDWLRRSRPQTYQIS
ncbi:hypothetical protein BDZ85DRAFT_251369 [Elsinoe ampelina]|uniref:Uncharacterized protein n=1 Tax=Elsinoe ampelina TaxID=302913 RepID=A0A6A6G7W2_9PEZI|nr:hypothetical protein BDZ85DRAFT_251369 [Elsinoe ampelina]